MFSGIGTSKDSLRMSQSKPDVSLWRGMIPPGVVFRNSLLVIDRHLQSLVLIRTSQETHAHVVNRVPDTLTGNVNRILMGLGGGPC